MANERVLAIDAGSRLLGWCLFAAPDDYTVGALDLTKVDERPAGRIMHAAAWLRDLVAAEAPRAVVIEKANPQGGTFMRGSNPQTTDLLAGVSWALAFACALGGTPWYFADAKSVKVRFSDRKNADKGAVYAALEELGYELPRGPRGGYNQDACDAIALAHLAAEKLAKVDEGSLTLDEALGGLYGPQKKKAEAA